MTVTEAMAAWGAYDNDEPFPLFARARELGPAHPITLADGHDAWLIVRYDEARAALGDHRLYKNMHAAMANNPGVVAEGLPGPAFATHMLEGGVNVHTIQRLMGHRDLSTTTRYFHLARAHLTQTPSPLELPQEKPPLVSLAELEVRAELEVPLSAVAG